STASPVIVDSTGAFNAGYNPHSGLYCFAGGNGLNSHSSGLIQNVKLLGGVEVEVSVTFRSSSSAIVNKVSTGELTCKTSNPRWCRYINAYLLPSGTRSIDYTMTFTRKDSVGTNIDSYIADNSLRII
ncbi:unnamed protein product, partial [Rotaria magnacalcarata]